MNRLYFGDCLTVMQEFLPLGSVDLIYLDPPFNSNRDYNAIYKDETGRPLPDQVENFGDMWRLNEQREREFRQMPILMRDAGIDDEATEFWRLWLNALRKVNPNLLAYLTYMTQRLLVMRSILKPTGSVYLHCDPTASHYIKVMMDAIFGHKRFRNEIIWGYKTGGRAKRHFPKKHDTILWYSKSGTYVFNYNDVSAPRDFSTMHEPVFEDEDGRRYQRNIKNGKEYRYYEDEGVLPNDYWTDIPAINPSANERLGYSTQKPTALLDRIIRASSNPGDVILDPFCGCATTLEVAHKLDRRWIGIDIAIHAVKRVARVRLQERLRLSQGVDFEIDGVPRDIEGARHLWESDKYHFQRWAVEEVDGFVTSKKTADGGIDGRLYFALPQQAALERDPLRSMVIEVKGGRNVGIGVVRDLRGVLERDEAEMAGLIVLDDPGPRKRANFAREMATAGDLDVMGTQYARMQLLTVEDILAGKRFSTPGAVGRTSGQGLLAV